MTCDEIRLSLGALALGSLDDDEARVVREHLPECPECELEYQELAALPRLLGLVQLTEVVAGPPAPSPDAQVTLLSQVAAERRAASRRRLFRAVGGGLTVAAGAATVGFLLGGTPAPAEESPELEAADMMVEATDQDTGVWAEVALNEVGWGTRIALELSGVDAGETCKLVANSAAGEEVAGTWRVPPNVKDYITIPGAIGASLADIESFDVISGSGERLVHIPYREAVALPPAR